MAFACLTLNGCAGGKAVPASRTQAVHPYRAMATHSPQWILADSLWELRGDPEAANRSLKAYRSAVKRQRKVPELMARMSHACNFVASYIESSPDKRDALFREGQDTLRKA